MKTTNDNISGFNEASCRTEVDSMGEVRIPVDVYYGPETQRAVANFPISGFMLPDEMISALGLIKKCAALVNIELGLLSEGEGRLIVESADEVWNGLHSKDFVVDIFQTGSGTSSNMNANEVIARRAEELSDWQVEIEPHDHVNMCQSSNDVFPTAIHLSVAALINERLFAALNCLKESLEDKAKQFENVVKTGRTHLQDAALLTLGQEFSGYQSQVEHIIARISRALVGVYEVPLGGTAVGTGLNSHPEFGLKVIKRLKEITGIPLVEAQNHFEAQSCRDAVIEISGELRGAAISLSKIANDLRWMASGPRCGLAEISLPEVAPGSSMMPGKSNPVIIESLLMVCAQVIGNDAAVAAGGYSGGNFELNTMMPLMAHNLIQSIKILSAAIDNFTVKCLQGVEANRENLTRYLQANTAVCTVLAPKIGYQRASCLVREALLSGRSVKDLAREQQILPGEELELLFDYQGMTKRGVF